MGTRGLGIVWLLFGAAGLCGCDDGDGPARDAAVDSGGPDAGADGGGEADGSAGEGGVDAATDMDAALDAGTLDAGAGDSQLDAAVLDASTADSVQQVLGPAGGTLALGELTLSVPAGALTGVRTLVITRTREVPSAQYEPYSAVYRFEPEGLMLDVPVEVSVPYTGDSTRAVLYWSRSSGGYDALQGTVTATAVTAEVDHFSTAFVGYCELCGS